MKKVLALLLAAAMAVSAAGCSGGADKAAVSSGSGANSGEAGGAGGSVKGKTVVFIPKLTGNAFFESANAGAQKYSKEWGFTVTADAEVTDVNCLGPCPEVG